MHLIHIHKPMSLGASEWVSEWAWRSAQTKQAVRSKKMAGRRERMSGWANGLILYVSISSSFYPVNNRLFCVFFAELAIEGGWHTNVWSNLMNGQKNEWMNEWMNDENEWVNHLINDRLDWLSGGLNQSKLIVREEEMNELYGWMKEWMNGWMNEWTNNFKR